MSPLQRDPARVWVLAICAWLLVIPATVFLGAAALRLLQPRQYEPARTSHAIVQWTLTHVSPLGAKIFLAGMPAVACAISAIVLARSWRSSPEFRADVFDALRILRRRLALGFLTVAGLLSACILLIVAIHTLAD